MSYQLSAMTPGEDVDVMLVGPNIGAARGGGGGAGRLRGYAGVYGITDSFREGKQEINWTSSRLPRRWG